MNRPVVYDRHGNVIVEDDDRRVIPDGARLICGVTMIDHNSIQPGEGKMTVIVDGKELTAEDVARVLAAKDGEIAALKSQLPVQDSLVAARDAARQDAPQLARAHRGSSPLR